MSQINRGNNKRYNRQLITVAGEPWYVKLGTSGDLVTGFQLIWHSTTSAFTAILYSSCLDQPDYPDDGAAINLEHWSSEATDLPISTVSASAAGSKVYHVGNNGARHLLLAITPTADPTTVSVAMHGKD